METGLRQRQPRQRDKAHLKAITQCPCVICGSPLVQAAHIRYTAPGKISAGMGAKPDDKWTVPLCEVHHREQHSMGEREFWELKAIDPIELAERLYQASPDLEAMERICRSSLIIP